MPGLTLPAFLRRPWPLVATLLILLLLLLPLGWWQATATGPQVQVPMFYDAHYLFPRPWTQAQSVPGVPEPALVAIYGQNRLTQSFIAGGDNLGMVRLWLAGPRDTAVTVSLATADNDGYRGEILLTEGSDGAVYGLRLPPVAAAAGRTFRLTLAAPAATADEPLLVRTVGGDRLGAAVRLNEFTRPGNLDLATYARGLPGRWWLQAVTAQLLPPTFQLRLQQYKPWKGSIFSYLLVATAVLTLAFLLLARPRKRPLADAAGWGLLVLLIAFLGWQMTAGRLLLMPRQVDLVPSAAPLPVADVAVDVPRLVDDLGLTLWTARRDPEPRFVVYDRVDAQPALRVPAASQLVFNRLLPPNGRFRAGIMAQGEAVVAYEVRWQDEVLAAGEATAAPIWLDVDLAPYAGQAGSLHLITDGAAETAEALWLRPQLLAKTDWLLTDLPAAATAVDYRFDDRVQLAGYRVEREETQWRVTLYWRGLKPIDQYATVFVHALDESTQILAQSDAQPVQGSYPLPLWPVGVLVADSHIVPATAAAQLGVGLYDSATLENWLAVDEDGAAASGRILLPLESVP